ncbi:MAG: hypothetical protein P4L79_03350 [Legionella sp.]|uniref:hypothetical protein n=1 Tax=Legionella sp. TaxID=459 RepID=UPI00284EFDA9|nr:hypothetical protein [Legionella sp.]
MPKPIKVPELLRQGDMQALTTLSDSIGAVFEIGRKKQLGIAHTKNIAIYNEQVLNIKTSVEDLIRLHNALKTTGVENPQEILAQKVNAIKESMQILEKTTKDPAKKQFLMGQMNNVLNALSYAQSEMVRAPLREKFTEVRQQTETDYKQGKNGYYDAYVKEKWGSYSANYGKQLQEHVAKVHNKEFEVALEEKVQETITAGGLGLEREFEENHLESFTRLKEYELKAQGKTFKTLTAEEGKAIQAEFNAKFKDWVKDRVLAQGFKESFQGTPPKVLEKEFKADFDKGFHKAYIEHCKSRIKHYEDEVKVKLDNPNDPKLQLGHMKDVLKEIQKTNTGKSKQDVVAAETCELLVGFLEKLESQISMLTKGGITTAEAGAAALANNQIPQGFATLLNNCKSPKAKELMAREFPEFYQQIQGINRDIQAAQMKCEMSALQRMQGEMSGKKHLEEDVMLSDELAGGPLVVDPVAVSSAKTESFSKMKTQLHAQKKDSDLDDSEEDTIRAHL